MSFYFGVTKALVEVSRCYIMRTLLSYMYVTRSNTKKNRYILNFSWIFKNPKVYFRNMDIVQKQFPSSNIKKTLSLDMEEGVL